MREELVSRRERQTEGEREKEKNSARVTMCVFVVVVVVKAKKKVSFNYIDNANIFLSHLCQFIIIDNSEEKTTKSNCRNNKRCKRL